MFDHYVHYQGSDPRRRFALQVAAVASGITLLSTGTGLIVNDKLGISEVDAPTLTYVMVQVMEEDAAPPPPPPPPPPAAAEEEVVEEVEDIPDENPDEMGLPDLYFVLPEIVVVYDNVKHTALLVRHARVEPGDDPRERYAEAEATIEQTLQHRPGFK